MSTNTGRTYNLRQRKKVTGQVQDPQKHRKSKIPVSKKTTKGQTKTTESANSNPNHKTKARAIPDFKKLHQDWKDKFNKGKAVNKKTCTKIQAFDLSRPTSKSKGNVDKEDIRLDEPEEEVVDDSALQSILDGVGIEICKTPSAKGSVSKNTKASSSSCVLRPRQHQVQEIKTTEFSEPKPIIIKEVENDKENKQESKPTKKKQPMKDIQKEFDIEFETDANALTSILNHTGVSQASNNVIGRQTTAGISTANYSAHRSKMAHLRSSVYDHQPVRMSIYDRSWTKANLRKQLPSKLDTPSPLKPVLATPARVLQQKNQNQIIAKTPRTASRVINPKFSSVLYTVETSCNSPALRTLVNKPTPQRVANKASARKVRWAEVLKSPDENSITEGSGPDKVATTLQFDEEQTSMTAVKPTEDEITETYLQKVIELEQQLLKEIHNLQVKTQPIQETVTCDSSKHLTNKESASGLTTGDADCALDLTKNGKQTKVLYNSPNVNENLPVDLSIKTPVKHGLQNEPDKIFKTPFPSDRLQSVIPLHQKTPFSAKTERMVSETEHCAIPDLHAELSTLHAVTNSVVDPLSLTSCVTHASRSVSRPLTWESNTSEVLGLPTPVTSKLYNGTNAEINRTRDLITSEGRTKNHVNQLLLSCNAVCSKHVAPVNSFQHPALQRQCTQSIQEHSVCKALQFESPHNPTSSKYHNKRFDTQIEENTEVVSVPMPLTSQSYAVQNQTLGSKVATNDSLCGLEVKDPRPAGEGSYVHHDVRTSALSRGTESSKTISSTSEVEDKSMLPVSAWGEPCQTLAKKQILNQDCETPSLNLVTPLVKHRNRLLGQSSLISPVPRYVHKPGFTRVNDDVPNPTDRQNKSLSDSGAGVVSEASDISSKTGNPLTHSQKLDHVMRMALDTGGKYQEVMLNEEVALFACRLMSRFSPKAKVPHDFTNPVGSTLLYGDDMHFIPIDDSPKLKALPVPGSAFMVLKH
ncbi:uncharacterized protein LOC117106027 [Anneissia japonica]|uniref:uncharacterized protein LOC117106027 n=1 Tax=Anneissia japonica TaxID=1529436 RepID=UPI001425972F|nr:uncharacterized protein LOC117106027 [Anneissia japonica]